MRGRSYAPRVRIGAYEVVGRIGEGGAGLVYRARGADGRDVALKVLRQAGAAASTGRFERERRLLAELDAEGGGFVPLLDAGETPQGPFLVMPFLAGGTLRERLAEGPMDPEEVHDLARFLGATLGRAHARGIVHRDLKPENILFTADDRPLVADLGLAKHFTKEAAGAAQSISLSRGGELRGTAGYMAPEQMKDAKNVGPAADIFAVGAILYECLTGQPAFAADNLLALFARVESGHHVPVKSARRDAPLALARAIESALATEPSERPRDGTAFLAALDERPSRRARKTAPIVVGALIAAAVAVSLVAVVVTLRPPRPPSPDKPHEKPGDDKGPGPVPPRSSEPGWVLALPERERPKLPPGVKATDVRGEWLNEKDGTVLVRVRGGDCTLGLPGSQRHESIAPFLISKYEITNAQFERFVAETHYVTSAEELGAGFVTKIIDSSKENELMSGYDTRQGVSWRDPELKGKPAAKEPVIQVSWKDAAAYCKWAGLVLPTPEQWEKAASWDPDAHRARRYPWGDDKPSPESPRFANLSDRSYYEKYEGPMSDPYYEDGVSDRAPVGSFPLDRAPCGAVDMGGNVSEWCRTGGKVDLDVDVRVYRGGNWCSTKLWAQCAFASEGIPATSSTTWTGFRPILER